MRLRIDQLRQASRALPDGRPFPNPEAVRQMLEEVKAVRPDPWGMGHPWIPEPFVRDLEHHWRVWILWYVAVDDLDEGIVVFSTAVWPTLDSEHRLAFPDDQMQPFEVPIALAEPFFSKRTVDPGQIEGLDSQALEEARTRPLRPGDVFAMSDRALQILRGLSGLDPETLVGPLGDIPEFEALDLSRDVFDITREAREAAKVAYYAAAAQTIDPRSDADYELAEVIWSEHQTDEGPDQNA
jgi:hypothetical protein